MAAWPDRVPDGDPPGPPGMWRAVLEALESNRKTARLVLIILALAVLGAAVRLGR